eukprot:9989950-Ditylum_brightwellii.AAC.1
MQTQNGGEVVDLNHQNICFRYGNAELSIQVLIISSPREKKPASKDYLFALEQGRIGLWLKTLNFTF